MEHGESNKSDLAPATDESEASTKPGVRVSERRNKSSESKELDFPLAESELAFQLARLPELEAAISAAQSRLAVLLGTYVRTSPGPFVVLRNCPLFLSVCVPERRWNCYGGGRISAPLSASSRRPTARIGAATADLFPSVTLTAGFGGQGTTGVPARRECPRPDLVGRPGRQLAGARLWPPRCPHRHPGNADHEVLVRYKKTIIAAVEEVNEAVGQYRLDLQRWRALSAALEAVRHAVNLTTERYKRGDTEFRVLLSEQRWKYAREEQVAIAAEIATLRYVAFYKALGSGWELYENFHHSRRCSRLFVAGVGRLIGGWR